MMPAGTITIEVRAELAGLYDGVGRLLGEAERAGWTLHALTVAASTSPASAVLRVEVPAATDLDVLECRLSRSPSVVEARVLGRDASRPSGFGAVLAPPPESRHTVMAAA